MQVVSEPTATVSEREREILATIVELARRLVGSQRASLMLPIRSQGELQVAASSGLPEMVAARARVRVGESIAGLVAQTREPIQTNEQVGTSPRASRYRTGSFISVPVPLSAKTCGVLSVADPIAGVAFRANDLPVLQTFADFIVRQLAGTPVRQQADDLKEAVHQAQWELIRTQERERHRIAQDLHDEVGHALTVAIFRTDLDSMALPQEAEQARAALARARESLLACTAVLHDVAFALRPRILHDLGLSAAIRSLAQQTMGVGGPQVIVTIAGVERTFGEDEELAVFRIVQEALTNICKYAQATRAWIRLSFSGRRFLVIVEDDGVGLDEQGSPIRRVGGMGLQGMRERAELLGGTLTIGKRRGGGTRIAARLPLRRGQIFGVNMSSELTTLDDK